MTTDRSVAVDDHDDRESTAWWTRPFRSFQTNLREIDADLDVTEVLDAIEDYGADVWLLSVGGIIANYPSAADPDSINPVLRRRTSGDLIGDAVAAAKARGIRVLGRMDFSKVDRRRGEAHPEWCFVDAAGQNQVYNGYLSVCPSGDYYQRHIFDVITDVLTRYDLSGFFFNWMSFNERDYSRRYWGVCQCLSCRSRFAEFARQHPGDGSRLPVDDTSPTYPLWQRFTASVLDDLTARMRRRVAGLSPNAALILGDRADVTFHEANNAVGRPLWHHATAEAVSAARTVEPDRPVMVNATGFLDMPYRLAGEDPHHFAQYLLQAIAHGANPGTYIMGRPTDSPYPGLAAGRSLTRFHRDNAELYDGLRSTAQVGLVRRSGAGLAAADPYTSRRTSEFRGWYLGLSESHVPFDVLRLDRLDDVAPDRYRMLILPDLGELAPSTVATLDRFVAGGGLLVATGDSGFDGSDPQLAGSPVRRRLATFDHEETLRSLHLPVGSSDGTYPLPIIGSFQIVKAADDAETDWRSLGRSWYGPPEKCYGYEPTEHPGWAFRRAGEGGIVIMPWLPGVIYHDLGLSLARDAVIDRVCGLVDEPVRWGGTLPERIQVVPGRTRDGSDVVHLLNRTGDAPQRFLAPTPVSGATLIIPGPIDGRKVIARRADRALPTTETSGVIAVELPEIGLFEVLRLQTSELSNK